MEISDWQSLFERFRIPMIIALVGIIFIGLGIIFLSTKSEDKVEIISAENTATSGQISADIEGAVEKPGVYSLDSGSRINDLLILAGGLSALADREWVEKSLNRAQKLTDGAKIYVPRSGEKAGDAGNGGSVGAVSGETAGNSALVNINTASSAQLEALWGIGPATAKNIIENRPYTEVGDLLSKKILKSNVYQKIFGQLTVF